MIGEVMLIYNFFSLRLLFVQYTGNVNPERQFAFVAALVPGQRRVRPVLLLLRALFALQHHWVFSTIILHAHLPTVTGRWAFLAPLCRIDSGLCAGKFVNIHDESGCRHGVHQNHRLAAIVHNFAKGLFEAHGDGLFVFSTSFRLFWISYHLTII